jgi:hypothetical protein
MGYGPGKGEPDVGGAQQFLSGSGQLGLVFPGAWQGLRNMWRMVLRPGRPEKSYREILDLTKTLIWAEGWLSALLLF